MASPNPLSRFMHLLYNGDDSVSKYKAVCRQTQTLFPRDYQGAEAHRAQGKTCKDREMQYIFRAVPTESAPYAITTKILLIVRYVPAISGLKNSVCMPVNSANRFPRMRRANLTSRA